MKVAKWDSEWVGRYYFQQYNMWFNWNARTVRDFKDCHCFDYGCSIPISRTTNTSSMHSCVNRDQMTISLCFCINYLMKERKREIEYPHTYHASDCGRACDDEPTASRVDTVPHSVLPERPTAR